jgi:beta-galactosidase
VEYFLNLKAALKNQDGLLEPGTELAAEQFKLPVFVPAPAVNLADFAEIESG